MGNSEPKLTPKEQARNTKRTIDRAARKVDRERKKLEANETKTLNEIKKLAKINKHTAAKTLIKDLCRTRHQIDMYYNMGSQMKAMGLKMGSIYTNAEISSALKDTTKCLSRVNATMDVKDIMQTMKTFQKESQKMEMGQDMMNEAIDMGMEDYTEEEDMDKVYGQICEEIGIDASAEHETAGRKQVQEEEKADVADLEARLNQLKR